MEPMLQTRRISRYFLVGFGVVGGKQDHERLAVHQAKRNLLFVQLEFCDEMQLFQPMDGRSVFQCAIDKLIREQTSLCRKIVFCFRVVNLEIFLSLQQFVYGSR